MQKKIGIIGASGLTGLELIRVLSKREDITLEVINSRSLNGKSVFENFPEITSDKSLMFTNLSLEEIEEIKLDLIFLAMENGEAMKIAPQLSCKIVDLSADFRFQDLDIWSDVYKMKHCSPKIEQVYGLPEVFSEQIQSARVVANPGCFATASELAIFPLKNFSPYIERIICDGKTGISGAGRRSTDINNYNYLSDNVVPYLITNHRHEAEIQQFFPDFPVSFTPHIVPMMRGMLVTTHIFFDKKNTPSKEEVLEIFQEFYKDSEYVEIFSEKLPTPRQVKFSNKCFLGGFEIDKNGRLVIISVIDNLGKGASLQAVQNMEVMLGN